MPGPLEALWLTAKRNALVTNNLRDSDRKWLSECGCCSPRDVSKELG